MLDGIRVRARTFVDEDPGPMRAAARSSPLVREVSAIGHRALAPPARVAEHKKSQPYRTAAHTARDPELSVPWDFDFGTDTGWQGLRTAKGELPSTANCEPGKFEAWGCWGGTGRDWDGWGWDKLSKCSFSLAFSRRRAMRAD